MKRSRSARRSLSADATVLVGLEVTERQIFELPFQLPHPKAVGERRVDGTCLERAARALGARQAARMAQPHELLGGARKHQPRVTHHRQQHLAQGLGLTRIKPALRGPVTWQSEVAQADEGAGDAGGSLTEGGRGLLACERAVRERGARQERQRKLAALGECADDLRRLARVRELCTGAGFLQPHARGRDGGAKLGRTQEARFHG
jgi:hypothetical protein